MAEQDDDLPVPTHDDAIYGLCKTLINAIVKESEGAHGGTPREKLKNEIQHRTRPEMVGAIEAFSTYLLARATDRQAAAMETVARSAQAMATAETVDSNAQAMVDMRESKRDYLATTYSLPTVTLSLLWAMRGMLVDASIRSLSRPDRFDPYRRLTTEEVAWSLRITVDRLWSDLPRTTDGRIDYGILDDFDIAHYGGTDEKPDEWLFNG
jgi:hypothetical protein